MFSKKYNITLLDSKWKPIKNLKVESVPRRDEFIYLGDKYYRIINVVHSFIKKHDILVIIEEINNYENPDNQHILKKN